MPYQWRICKQAHHFGVEALNCGLILVAIASTLTAICQSIQLSFPICNYIYNPHPSSQSKKHLLPLISFAFFSKPIVLTTALSLLCYYESIFQAATFPKKSFEISLFKTVEFELTFSYAETFNTKCLIPSHSH